MVDISEEQLRRLYEKLDLAGRNPNRPPPPSTRESNGGRIPHMSDWEPRVSRLEMGFIAGCVLIFTTILGTFLLLSSQANNTTLAVSELRGSVRLLEERSIESNKRLERIEAKLDALSAKR